MPEPLTLLAALFLPLYPFSVGFNLMYARAGSPWARAVLLLVWPQVGLLLLGGQGAAAVPAWLVAWALATSALYGLRALTLRDVGRWTAFLATSAWALLWIGVGQGVAAEGLRLHALGFSLPLVLLAALCAVLERRLGAAYSGLHDGLGSAMPRFAVILVLVVLAVTATPLFPSFFAMLATVFAAAAATPLTAIALLAIWWLWSWAGVRLLQGLLVGPGTAGPVPDLGRSTLALYAVAIAALMLAGLYNAGGSP